jgi:2'-5' RNA ligase
LDPGVDRDATWRLFVALELPGSMGDDLAYQQQRVRRHLPGDHVRWVRPAGIHLTLRFLGAVPPRRLPLITTALRAVAAGHARLRLQPAGLGAFGRPRHLKAIWIGLAGEEARLALLVRDLDDALAASGFPAREQVFRGHLTLGRVREECRPGIRSALHAEVMRCNLPAAAAADLQAVILVRSHLGQGGARYEVLERVVLGRKAAS